MPTETFFSQLPPFPEDVPVISLPRLSYAKLLANDDAESAAVLAAARDQGIFLLDFGDSEGGQELVRDVETAMEIGQSFLESDLSTKKRYSFLNATFGYKPAGLVSHDDGSPDTTELYGLSRDTLLNGDGAMPRAFADRRLLLADVAGQLHCAATCVLGHLARQLGIAPAALEALHDPARPTSTVLRFLHNDRLGPGPDSPRSMRAHTDSGSVTVLFAALGGLQVLPPPAADGDEPASWLWVRPEPGCAIVNVGDALVRWTGGLVHSPLHRVVCPPGAQARAERFSFGYFLRPTDEAPMRRLRGGSIPPVARKHEAEDARAGNFQRWLRKKNTRKQEAVCA